MPFLVSYECQHCRAEHYVFWPCFPSMFYVVQVFSKIRNILFSLSGTHSVTLSALKHTSFDLKTHISIGKLAVVGIEKLKHTHKLVRKFSIWFTIHTQAHSPGDV